MKSPECQLYESGLYYKASEVKKQKKMLKSRNYSQQLGLHHGSAAY